jgi:hypothetical protein
MPETGFDTVSTLPPAPDARETLHRGRRDSLRGPQPIPASLATPARAPRPRTLRNRYAGSWGGSSGWGVQSGAGSLWAQRHGGCFGSVPGHAALVDRPGPIGPRGDGRAAPWPRRGRRAAVGAPGVAGEGARRGQGVGGVAGAITGSSAAIDERSLRIALRPRTCLGVPDRSRLRELVYASPSLSRRCHGRRLRKT